jgi:hypothetical protein
VRIPTTSNRPSIHYIRCCFHAYSSNIEHIEKALVPYDVELVHFVDPSLDRIKTGTIFAVFKAKDGK